MFQLYFNGFQVSIPSSINNQCERFLHNIGPGLRHSQCDYTIVKPSSYHINPLGGGKHVYFFKRSWLQTHSPSLGQYHYGHNGNLMDRSFTGCTDFVGFMFSFISISFTPTTCGHRLKRTSGKKNFDPDEC